MRKLQAAQFVKLQSMGPGILRATSIYCQNVHAWFLRVIEQGEVLAVDRDGFREIIATDSELSDLILKAFILRREIILKRGFAGIRIIGSKSTY